MELTDWFSINFGTDGRDFQGTLVFNFCLNFSAYIKEQEKVISRGTTNTMYSLDSY